MGKTFEFSSTEVELTINGVDCTLDVGDAAMQDRLLEAATLLQATSLNSESANTEASKELRRLVAAILGDDVTNRIYGDQAPNLYKDVELVLFLRQVMDEAEPAKRFDATMGALNALIGLDD